MTNLNPEQVNQAKNTLENSKNILLAIPADTKADNIAAALSLYLSLSAAGKQVSLVSPTEMTVNHNYLIGVDKISTNFSATSGRNLIISFPYQEGSIEKVSYNIENETFNLVIEPRESYPPIVPEMMQYRSSNGSVDCIVTIGVSNPSELRQTYLNNQNLFKEKTVINIDINTNNTNFGKINLVDPSTSSNSELVLSLMDQMGLSVEADMATNLLAGLTAATDNFSSVKTTAATFENAALLLKYGAKKQQIKDTKSESLPQFTQAAPKYDQSASEKSATPFGKTARTPFGRPTSSPAPSFFKPKPQTQPQQPAPQMRPFMKQAPQSRPQQPPQQQQPQTGESGRPPETPPDWLKPKIYKGSTLL